MTTTRFCQVLVVLMMAIVSSGCAHLGARNTVPRDEWEAVLQSLSERGASISGLQAKGSMILERPGGIRNRLLCRLRYQEPDYLLLDASHRLGGKVLGVVSEGGRWHMEYQTASGMETWQGSDQDLFLGMAAIDLTRCLVFGWPPEEASRAKVRHLKDIDGFVASFKKSGYHYTMTVQGPSWHMAELEVRKGKPGPRVARFVFDNNGQHVTIEIPPAEMKADIAWESVNQETESASNDAR